MKKLLGGILCFAMLFGTTISFGEVATVVELYEHVKTMENQLTQGDQEDLVESVEVILKDKTVTLKQVQQLIDVSVDRLDADKVTVIVEAYCELLMISFDSGQLTLNEVQSATDQLLGLLGKKVIKIEGINQDHIKILLKMVTDKNAMMQGEVAVQYQEILKLAGLDKMLLDVERAYRIVNSGFNSYNSFKDLGRNLQKQLVLLSETDNVDLTIEADMVKRLVTDNIGVSLNHNGLVYQIPTTFLQKHIGDLKIVITPLTIAPDTLDYEVTGGIIKPVLLRNVAIGYATNPEMIKISVPVETLENGLATSNSYSLMTEKLDVWSKLITNVNYGDLTTAIKGTAVVGAGIYQAKYTDLTGHWAQKNITDLLAHGIAVDNSTVIYDPNAVMTRGEFIRMLINIVGTEGKSENIFTDVSEGSKYEDIIGSVIYYGLTTGVTNDEFSPETLLTRQDMVTLADRTFEINKGYKLDGGFLKFKDMNMIAPYAKDAVQAMEAAGYVSGYDDNTFKPTKTVTKAEAISVLSKMLKQ